MVATGRFVVVVAVLPLLCLGVIKHQKNILSSGASDRPAPNHGRSCTDPSCTSSQESKHDINATEGQTDANNDADALADQVKKNSSATAGSNDFGLPDEAGFLQRHVERPAPNHGRSCTDPSCTSSQESKHDINATEGQTDANNDADALADQVKKNGSATAGSNDFGLPDEAGFLQRHVERPTPNHGKSCTDPSCTSSQESKHDINATEGQTDANNDADALADQVKKNGSATAGSNDFGLPDEAGFLQRHAERPTPNHGRSCTDPSCTSSQESKHDINATEGQTDANNDADALADQVRKNGSATAGSNDFGLPDEGFVQKRHLVLHRQKR